MDPQAVNAEELRIYEAICSDNFDFIQGGHTCSELNLAKAYETVKLRNICISDNTKLAVVNTLLNYRYLEEKINNNPKITERIEILREQISSICEMSKVPLSKLNEVGISEINNLDILETTKEENIFVYKLKLIAKNFRILKRDTKVNNDRKLSICDPIEYYLNYYLYALEKPREAGVCLLLLNKRKLLRYMSELSKELTVPNNVFNKSVEKDSRETVGLIRNVASINRIVKYMKIALSPENDGNGIVDKLVVERTIQVIGENLKATEESPHISQSAINCLSRAWPSKIREITIPLRNLLSHSECLSIKSCLRRNTYHGIRKELEKIYLAIRYLSIETYHEVLKEIILDVSSGNNVKHIQQWISVCSMEPFQAEVTEFIEDTESQIRKFIVSNTINFDVVDICVKQLEIEKIKVYDCLRKLKYDLDYIRSAAERKSLDTLDFEIFQRNTYKNCSTLFHSFLDTCKFFKYMESCSEALTDSKVSEEFLDFEHVEFQNISEIRLFKEQLEPAFNKRLKAEYFVKELLLEIGEDIRVDFERECKNEYDNLVNRVKKSFHKDSLQLLNCFDNFFNKCNTTWAHAVNEKELSEKSKSILKRKDEEVANTFTDNVKLIEEHFPEITSDDITKGYEIFRERKNAKYALESILMDMLAVMKRNESLPPNQSYLDRPAPTLLGVHLRNYLAHGDCLIDSFKGYSRMALYLNARYLMGKKLELNKHCKASNTFLTLCQEIDDEFKRKIQCQQKYFVSAQKGKLESEERFGSDFLKQNVLHYAAKNDRWNVFDKFCRVDTATTGLKCPCGKSHLEKEDSFRKTVFESAIKSDSRKVLRLFVTERLPLNDKIRSRIETNSLHFAICNGRKKVFKEIVKKCPAYLRKNLQRGMLKGNSGHVGKWNVMHEAVRSGRVPILELLVKCVENNCIDLDINGVDDNQLSPLHVASLSGHLEMVKYLISLNASMEQVDANNYTPLHFALRHGHTRVIRYLINRNASIAAITLNEQTVLHLSAIFCDVGINEIIIKRLKKNIGLRLVDFINHEDFENRTPLDTAVVHRGKEIVNLFIKHGASINCRREDTRTPPLHLAARYGNLEAFNILLKYKADLFAIDVNESTVLHEAAKAGHLEIIDQVETFLLLPQFLHSHQRYIRAFKDLLSVTDSHGRTTFHRAAENGHKDVVEKIYDSDETIVDTPDHKYDTALLLAAKNGQDETFEFILNKCEADVVSKTNVIGRNALHIASVSGHKGIVKTILHTKKLNINNADLKGNTPLIYAIEKGHKSIVQLLLENNASTVEANLESDTPLSVAIKMNYIEIFEMILIHPNTSRNAWDQPELFHLAVRKQRVDMVQRLIRNDANYVNSVVEKATNNTPLHISTEKANSRMVDLLLRKGAEVNASNSRGDTALHIWARGHFEVEIVERLLEKGADINCQNKDGSTPLHLATMNGRGDNVDILLQRAANTSLGNKRNQTPVMLATDDDIRARFIERQT